MIKKKKVLADILSLMLLALSVISFIPSFVSFDVLTNDVNYIVFSGLVVLASFFIFFLVKNIDVNGRGEKVFSIIMLSCFFLLSFLSLFFFKNSSDESYLLYRKIKTLLPYLFILSEFYACDSIKDIDRRFTTAVYLTSAYFLIGFLSLDVDGMILVGIANIIYSLFKCRAHFIKSIIFVALAGFIVAVLMLAFNAWTDYLNMNADLILTNINKTEILQYATLFPSNHQYSGTNYLLSLTNSFGLIGLIIATILFLGLFIISLSEGVCVPYWIFIAVLYVLSFFSLTTGSFNFEFYLFSPSLVTIALNAAVFGVVTNKKGV